MARARRAVGAFAVLFLAAHLAFLPPSLEDFDSVNFALGVRDFDVARHQPHPPGYPVYIALGKLGTAALALTGVSMPDVRGLAMWSALGGAALVLGLFAFFRSLETQSAHPAAIAAILAACCPLVWFSSARPLSDIPGLAVSFAALAALRSGLGAGSPIPVAGAFLAGLAIGIRSQTAMLTMPMLLFAVIAGRRRLALTGAVALGIAVWAIPLVVLSGGPGGYIRSLGRQAGDDFTGVVMLWTNPTPRVALEAVLYTFARPWDSPILAGVILSLASAGALLLATRSLRTFAILLLTFGPYTVFHLLFQEPLTTRYALPIVPLIAYLVAVVLTEAKPRVMTASTVAIVGAALILAVPATVAFGREPSPIFAFLSEMRLLQERGAAPHVAMHRRVFTESRRARLYAGDVPGTILPTPRDYEWLQVTRAWREGHNGETWFIADPRRTDLALIDRAHTRTRQYRWPFRSGVYVGGIRPDELDWHVVDKPGWFLEEGWALTPETAGIADRDGWGPHRRPSVGWIRRGSADSVMVIGGRHLGSDPPADVVAAIDDRPVATLNVRPGYFLHFVSVPANMLAGSGRYAKLTVTARAPGPATPPVAIEQFDFQPVDRVVFGVDEGWYEPEHNPRTAKSWRWMSDRAVVRIHAVGKAVALRLTGESPLYYFDTPPLIRVTAGDRVLSDLRPSADFTAEVTIPTELLAAANNRVVITSDRTFVAGEREGTADRRRLAVKIHSLTVQEATR
jgi:hypothetical protein